MYYTPPDFHTFCETLLKDAMTIYRKELSGRATDMLREDEFTAIFWGKGVP